MQPAAVKVPMLFRDALHMLTQITARAEHRFWPLDYGLAEVSDEIRECLVGHNQVTDAVLLGLAIRHTARLATFDRQIGRLLPPASELRESLVVIPV
jgi:hypothetical protein